MTGSPFGPLLDARQIFALEPGDPRARAATSSDLEALWSEYASRRGFSLVETGRTIAAYVNHGRWVADCPLCNGGIAVLPGHDRGACLDCGGVFLVELPSPDELLSAVHALELRRPENRNWIPALESVEKLRLENEANGLKVGR